MKQYKWLDTMFVVLVILLCIYLAFGKLSSWEIRIWDEARNTINALEMSKSGFSLVTTFEGNPDHWNTKPPLLIWIMAMLYKFFGATEITSRLPSVLSALAFIPIFKYFLDCIFYNATHFLHPYI